MKNPAATIERAGKILFGTYWKSEFCETFEINPRTLNRMLAGKADVYPDTLAAVETALHDHGHALDALLLEFVERP